VERFHRSQRLLQAVLDRLIQCAGTPSAEVAKLVAAGRQQLKRRPRASDYGDVADANLSLAEEAWRAQKQYCGGAPADEVLALVFKRLAQ
jgi:hypothetical protein